MCNIVSLWLYPTLQWQSETSIPFKIKKGSLLLGGLEPLLSTNVNVRLRSKRHIKYIHSSSKQYGIRLLCCLWWVWRQLSPNNTVVQTCRPFHGLWAVSPQICMQRRPACKIWCWAAFLYKHPLSRYGMANMLIRQLWDHRKDSRETSSN